MNELVELSEREYQKISDLVYKQAGINLGDKKKSLVIGRLQKILKQNGFDNFSQYYNHVLNDKSGEALVLLLDRISTNHTFFFRENDHFNYFVQTAVPHAINQAIQRGEKQIRIWSAGCSSGEEPYTLAMLLSDYLKNYPEMSFAILGTDISTRVLEVAQRAEYNAENIERLPADLRRRFFRKAGEGRLRVSDEIRNYVLYKRLNLMRESFPFQKKFHIIFCRNVMIYFDNETRDNLVRKFAANLIPQGHLFIGHSETLGRNNQYFKYLKPAVYQGI